MKSFSYYCQGESHKSSEKPCQDRAYNNEDTKHLSMAIVCDGHGGERYFRSQVGAEMAVNITAEAIEQFVKEIHKSPFQPKEKKPLIAGWWGEKKTVFTDAPLTTYSEALTNGNDDDSAPTREESPAHKALMWLFSSIISKWNKAIDSHARDNELTPWELEHVEQRYLDAFEADRENPDATFEKTYGCTLMAYVQTRDYWFAFHIGDGKCVRFSETDEGELLADQPTPWDERCFLNKTTSLCDADAIREFRYCYEGDGKFPLAVFLGSDGIDDSYGDGDNLVNFYIEIYKHLATTSQDDVVALLKQDLPLISAKGSKDDMSVACVYDEKRLKQSFPIFVNYQMAKLKQLQTEVEAEIEKYEERVVKYSDSRKDDKRAQIELHYAQSDLEKSKAKMEKLNARLQALNNELETFNQAKEGQKSDH